jgi:hypothetical protein
MKRQKPQHLPTSPSSLTIRSAHQQELSATQREFNRLMKSLEAVQARHLTEQNRLDQALITSSQELMPLVEKRNRLERDLIFRTCETLQVLKLSDQRRRWLTELLYRKSRSLRVDPVGLTDEDTQRLDDLTRGFNPDPSPPETQEFPRPKKERQNHTDSSAAEKPGRKTTKAQAAQDTQRLELEAAKNRDLKSLYKQLAKALHPDLESDLTLKERKKVWMQRLNAAYATNDLREMLQLELEWLGNGVTNLTSTSDQKLEIYCIILREQIEALKQQIVHLSYEPQYHPLMRFRNGYDGNITNFATLKRELTAEARSYLEMLEVISSRNANSRRMIYQWADEYGYLSENHL